MKIFNLFRSKEQRAKDLFREAQLIHRSFTQQNFTLLQNMISQAQRQMNPSTEAIEKQQQKNQETYNKVIAPRIISCFDKAIALFPGFWEAFMAKGEFIAPHGIGFFEDGDYVPLEKRSDGIHYDFGDESLCYFERAYELNPVNSDLNYFLGLYYEKHNETDKALKFFESALTVIGDHRGAMYGKCRMLARKNNMENATICADQAKKTKSPSTVFMTNRWVDLKV